MVRPPKKELKKSQEMADEVIDSLVHDIPTKKSNKKKYILNVKFDPEWEPVVRNQAKKNGLTVSGYIKMLVAKDVQ